MQNRRPTGVTILGILQLIGGVISLIFGLSSLFFGGLFVVSNAAETAGAEVDLGPILLIAGVIALISGVIGLLAGYGLLTLKGWGWNLAVIFAGLNIVQNLLNLFQGAYIPGAIIGIVISGLILYYLFRPNVKRAFGKA
jgi:uncharacterized membrane protein (DUF2068 family)